MAQSIIDSADVHECESALDANWNERKNLIEQEFDLRLEIQTLLVKSDLRFEEARQRERVCKSAVRRNDEEYESIVARWESQIIQK